jgi:cytochrome d ubiquinol oxidase subunit II
MVDTTASQRVLGATFALSSVLVPFCMGAAVGGIASGRVPPEGTAGDVWTSWLNPTSILGGVLAVVVCAYLAAVYLVCDAARMGDSDIEAYFRRRAEAAAVVAGLVSMVGIFVLRADAEYLFGNLTGRGLPLVLISAAAGIAALILVARGRHGSARVTAVGAVAAVVVGWGVSQWPYILPESLTIEAGAAPEATLVALTIVTVAAVLVVGPSLGLLFWLDQKSVLDDPDSTVGNPPASG